MIERAYIESEAKECLGANTPEDLEILNSF